MTGPRSTRPTSWWWAPGSGLAAARELRARGSAVGARSSRPGGRTGAQPRPRRRQGRGGGRPVDRAHTGPARRARRRARSGDVPHPQRGLQRDRVLGSACAATGARSRASTRRPARRGARTATAQPAGPQGAAGRAVGGAPMPPASMARRPPPGCAETSPPGPVGCCSSSDIEAVWAAQPEDMSLLHVLFYIHSAGGLERLFDTEGGAQQDRFVGGSQLVPLGLARRARLRARACSPRRCAGSSTARTG